MQALAVSLGKLGRLDPMTDDQATAAGVEFFCPTCNLTIKAERVHHGTKAMVHIMRIPASCATCPPRGVPHIVEVRPIQASR